MVPFRLWQATSVKECYMVDTNRTSQSSANGTEDDSEYIPGEESPPYDADAEPRSPSEFGEHDLEELE